VLTVLPLAAPAQRLTPGKRVRGESVHGRLAAAVGAGRVHAQFDL
jgi:hypothetical protein